MKTPHSLLILAALALLLPLRAQTPAPDASVAPPAPAAAAPAPPAPDAAAAPDATAPDSGGSVSSAPGAISPPRNIMPMTLNHKPNPTPPPPELAVPIDKFFKGLKGGDYATAYETFLSGTRLGQQKEKMSVFISKTQEAFGLYGAINDYEIFDNYSIGSNVVVLTYLSRHAVQPLRWRFVYYRPDKTWGLINMGFDDVLLDMLD